MTTRNIKNPTLFFVQSNLIGDQVDSVQRTIGDLKGIFADEEAFNKLPRDEPAYSVSSFLPIKDGTPGGLYFGITNLYPGKVGDEYFMTKGHFHQQIDRAEYYWGLKGEGMLILMNDAREVWAERMFPGSLHYIAGGIAHRVANTGSEILSFAACWPSDAGHNYKEIADNGFAARLVEIDGKPQLI